MSLGTCEILALRPFAIDGQTTGGGAVTGIWTFDPGANRLNLFVNGMLMGQPWSLQANCVFEQTTPEGVLVGYDEQLVEVRARRLGD